MSDQQWTARGDTTRRTASYLPSSKRSCPSLSNFTRDEEFIDFLKKVELFVSSDKNPFKKQNNWTLYNNLKQIKQKF